MLRLALPVCTLLLCFLSPAFARDFEEEGRVRDAEALIAQLDAAQEAKSDGPLRTLLAQVPALHNTLRTRSAMPVSYTHLTLPTIVRECRSRWAPGQ